MLSVKGKRTMTEAILAISQRVERRRELAEVSLNRLKESKDPKTVISIVEDYIKGLEWKTGMK